MSDDLILKLNEIQEFIRESMCVKGEVKFAKWIDTMYQGQFLEGVLFEVNDKKRGKFFIGWFKDE